MARISSKVLFITTSPRTPGKMIPEIELLHRRFNGEVWNNESQIAFMKALREESFFFGEGLNDPAFSARDRITRAPKSLGFVSLSPVISLTPAGLELISSKRKEIVFLRQLLKFQLPSPYHTPSGDAASFWVKPYLEVFRLIRHFGTLRFDEIEIFALQLVDYREFDSIVDKIEVFRKEKIKWSGRYKQFKEKCLREELCNIYSAEIGRGDTKTRETNDKSLDKFLKTKASNMRDYADACVRYLRATGLVNISHVGKSVSIIPEKIEEVDYFLTNIDRNPVYVNNEYEYSAYLGNPAFPILLYDNKDVVIKKIAEGYPSLKVDASLSAGELRDVLDNEILRRKEEIIVSEVKEIKDYKQYDDIQSTFDQIVNNDLYDASLMLEWNTWRAMTMLDGGNIKANLKFDDFGKPMSTAQGNMSDIVCSYPDFNLSVEVTLASGHKQYEMEGEPVTRHLAKLKKTSEKPTYCLFVAPNINDSCAAYFFSLHKVSIPYFGGKCNIVPLPLDVFRKMIEDSYHASYTPNPVQVKRFFDYADTLAQQCDDDGLWFNQVKECASNWLEIQ